MIFAHRGNSSEAPENTLAAFHAARGAGAQGVEFDVQLSRDGVPVVIHDERLERTTSGKGWVGEYSLAQLRALEAGQWFGPAYAGERVPTLAEVLDLFAGSDTVLNIELKTNRIPYPGLVPAVLKEVERLGAQRHVVVSSFNHRSLKELQALNPRIACAAILHDTLVEPWEYGRRHGFQALHVHHTQVDAELAESCRSVGLALRAWTVDDVETARRLKELGVDALITNRPRELLAALAG